MLDDLVKSFRLHLSERLTSPLIGSFALSWLAWNFRFLIVIFSGESVDNKFRLIHDAIFPTLQDAATRGAALPLVTALIYIFLYPYPAKFVYTFTRKRQREILEVRRKIENETPLTIEDSRRIRSDLARAEQDFYSELDRKEREIERLKSQLTSQASEVMPSSAEIRPSSTKKSKRTPKELIDMLQALDSEGGTATESELISASNLARIEAEYNLGELVRMELATSFYSNNQHDTVYSFTHSGRAALLAARQLQVNT